MRVHVLALTYTCNYILDTAGKSVREYVWVGVYGCERERPGEAEACGVCYRYRATWPNADRDKGSPLLLSARPFASRGRAPAPIPLLRASISALEAKRERAIANEHRRERERKLERRRALCENRSSEFPHFSAEIPFTLDSFHLAAFAASSQLVPPASGERERERRGPFWTRDYTALANRTQESRIRARERLLIALVICFWRSERCVASLLNLYVLQVRAIKITTRARLLPRRLSKCEMRSNCELHMRSKAHRRIWV